MFCDGCNFGGHERDTADYGMNNRKSFGALTPFHNVKIIVLSLKYLRNVILTIFISTARSTNRCHYELC